MGGPGSGRKRTLVDVAGPRGAQWREIRRLVLMRDAYVCGICGHHGANEVDHILPGRLLTGRAYYDPANLRAAHGTSSRCPVCFRACNQARRASGPAASPAPAPGERHEPHAADPFEVRLVPVAPGRRVRIRNRDRCEWCRSRDPLPSACWAGTCGESGEAA